MGPRTCSLATVRISTEQQPNFAGAPLVGLGESSRILRAINPLPRKDEGVTAMQQPAVKRPLQLGQASHCFSEGWEIQWQE